MTLDIGQMVRIVYDDGAVIYGEVLDTPGGVAGLTATTLAIKDAASGAKRLINVRCASLLSFDMIRRDEIKGAK